MAVRILNKPEYKRDDSGTNQYTITGPATGSTSGKSKRSQRTARPESNTHYTNTSNVSDAELERKAIYARSIGAKHVAITGSWVWAEFDGKPDVTTRNKLKAEQFIFCKHKMKWAFRGKQSHSKKSMSWDYITRKYGERIITGDDN